MKKYIFSMATAMFLFAGCSVDNQPMTETQCKQSLCTEEHCFVWSDELQRCGTATALKKEEKRVKKLATAGLKDASLEVKQQSALPDSLKKIEKKISVLKKDVRTLGKEIDSLRVLDSASGSALLAEVYLKQQQDAEKKALEEKYKALQDSVQMLNLLNKKTVTAVQWVEYNKRKKKKRLEQLELKIKKK